MMNKSINAQVQALALTKNPPAIKLWWNNLSTPQKALAIASIGALSSASVYYFVVAGTVYTTTQVVAGTVYTALAWGALTYTISKSVLDTKSISDSYESEEDYDINA